MQTSDTDAGITSHAGHDYLCIYLILFPTVPISLSSSYKFHISVHHTNLNYINFYISIQILFETFHSNLLTPKPKYEYQNVVFVLFCAGPCPPAPRSESSVSPEKVSGPEPLAPASQLSSWSIPRRRRAVAQWHNQAASHWSELANSRLWLVEGLWAGALIALPHHHSVCDGKCQTVATPPTSGPEPPLAPLSSHKTRVTREWALKPQPMTDNSWSHPEPSLSLDIAISDRQYVVMFYVLLDQSDCLQGWSIWASDSPVQLFKIATLQLSD